MEKKTMKPLFVIVSCVVVFTLIITGCQPQSDKPLSADEESHVEVFIEGGGQFPQFLVGSWKENDGGWEITFEPNGTISSVTHTIGQVKVSPGRPTVVPMIEKGKGIFEPGVWTVRYLPESNELSVEIVLKHFRAQSGNKIVEGSSRDFFIGTVAEDSREWAAEWLSFPVFVVSTGPKGKLTLPVDYNENPKTTLIFEKVGQEQTK